MLRRLRAQVQQLLTDVPASRRPALRRSDEPDALLATDLPLLCPEEETRRFIRAMEDQGWRVWEKAGWLLLDVAIEPPAEAVSARADGETGCCLSLLVRHPAGEADPAEIRALIKAEEAGKGQVERLCALWHRQWAEKLRRGESLPGGLLPYLICAARRDTKEDAE